MDTVNCISPSKVCDLTYLQNLSAGDLGFIRQVLTLFFQQVPVELNNLTQHIDNLTNVKNTAHKLKSSVSLVGAESMVVRLKQIELLALEGVDKEQIRQLIHELLQLYGEAKEELETYLDSSC